MGKTLGPRDDSNTTDARDDVFMVDEIAYDRKLDPCTGHEVDPDSDPKMISTAAGVIWDDQHATFVKRGGKWVPTNELLLGRFVMPAIFTP
jgi:hypothetical protein